ncbi:DUF3891 family protein [Oscillatoria salina]|uniref:DUF3891 family protein n=1 Tax=Oscillatoria salina TaxID=331517 RepID=UPI0013B8E25C|nr:DUF3891 family protein [Oscillatoria salina]MBZ8181741.1 DUF3891 family protein [Oscillatoria salina IIICB1]NET89894.1 DUF3891 family protein [Kamptonema sp. SIO1D9]
MIVNLLENGWEIIYHRAHALLAAQIAGYWQKEPSSPSSRLFETVAAIAQHDDLEREWEEELLTSAGAPLDFRLEKSLSVEQLYGQIEEAFYRGRWVAMLTSMHLCFLNQAKSDKSEELKKFLDEQKFRQQQWRKELGINDREAEKQYAFMRWCDRLSLILCLQEIPSAHRSLEIITFPDGTRYDIQQLENSYLTVTPWVFAETKFTVNVDACYLDRLKFESNDEIKAALKTAPRKLREWTFVKDSC